MEQKFTTMAQEALGDAIQSASAAGNPQVEPLHLLDALLRTYSAAQAWEAVRAGTPLPLPGTAVSTTAYRRWERWQACARDTDVDGMLTRAGELGIRLVVPGDPEWPSQLDLLAERRPYALWVRGTHDLRNACLRSVSIVGSRAASAYGLHVAVEMAATLAHHGWCVVSGGAYALTGQPTGAR